MSDGILSQDEIDALLGGGDGDEEGTPADADGDIDVEALGEVLRVAMEASVDGLGDILQSESTLHPGEVRRAPFNALLERFEGPQMAVQAELDGTLQGVIVYVLPPEAVAGLGEMMLGGDSGNADLTEENLGGFREAMEEVASQLSGAFTTILATTVNVALSDPIELTPAEDTGLPVPIGADEEVVQAAFNASVGELSFEVCAYVPLDVAETLLQTLAQQMDEDGYGDEPEPATPASAADTSRSAAKSGHDVDHGQGRGAGQAHGGGSAGTHVREAQFNNLDRDAAKVGKGNIDLLLDVPLQVTVELGRTRMEIREILDLGKGSVVELEKLAGEPVEIYVNGKLIAKGEVVTIDENFGVKITDIVSRTERVTNLQ